MSIPGAEQGKDDGAVNGQSSDEPPPHMSSPLMLIEGFIEALTNTDKDGRIVVNKQGMGALW